MTTTQSPPRAVKDKNYDLLTVLQMSLENAWRMQIYIDDAERDGDQELASWFKAVQQNSVKAGEQGKQLLAQRLNRS